MVTAIIAIITIIPNTVIYSSIYGVLILCQAPEWLHTRIFLECRADFIPFSR